MARFYGRVGFVMTEEVEPGIWRPKETIRSYYGDVNDNVRRWEQRPDQGVNDNLELNNNISILADKFAYENLEAMRWVEFMGTRWRITSVNVNYPRLTLYFGGVYNATN